MAIFPRPGKLWGVMRQSPGIFDVRLEGSAILVNNQMFQIAINPARGTRRCVSSPDLAAGRVRPAPSRFGRAAKSW
jgi:hypothetical protein